MPEDPIRIDRIALKDLPALAAAAVDGVAPGTFIPITKHRAEAMAHNPNANPDDVALLLAKMGERNVGYFGVMPVILQHEGKLHKVHWLTTWAVAPEYLGKGLGSRLMEAALALDVDLAIVGSKPARRVSAKYGFHEVQSLDYVQMDFGVAGRYNPISLILRAVRKFFSLFKLRLGIEKIDKAIVYIFNLLLAPLFRPLVIAASLRATRGAASAVRAKPVVQVQPIAGHKASGTGFHRSAEVVNWMLTYPWALPAGASESEDLDYGFTDARPDFACYAYQLSSLKSESNGFICFQFSRVRGGRTLKVLDYQFVEEAPPALLAALALQEASRMRADVVEGPAELASPLRGRWLGRVLVRRKQRTLQVHPRSADSPLGQAWPQLEQSYVDGDMAFT